MKKRHLQYTMRGVGERADRVLRETALREGKSLNEVALSALDKGLGLGSEPVRPLAVDGEPRGKLPGPGGPPGLQNRPLPASGGKGGFDSHELPPTPPL